MSSRFDVMYRGHENDVEFLMCNGLIEMNAEEANQELMAMNAAVPISLVWANLDDNEKYIAWDSDLEKHLQHFARVIDMAGRESYEPHTIYNEMGLNWLDGFATSQGSLGSCIGGKTKVMTINGAIPIEELAGQTIDLLSHDRDTGKIVLRQGYVYKTKRKEIVEIGILGKDPRPIDVSTPLTKGKKVSHAYRLSSDHKVMLKSGQMVEAGQLRSGMRLMTGIVYVNGSDGYATVRIPTGKRGSGTQQRLHSLFAIDGLNVHHKDGDKLNNDRDNIELLTNSEHRKKHYQESDSTTFLSNKKLHQKTVDSKNTRRREELLNLFWELTTEAKSDREDAIWQAYNIRFPDKKYLERSSKREYANGRTKLLKRQVNKHFGSFEAWSQAATARNGTVVYTKVVGYEDCYDIEVYVDEPDDSRDFTNHNFFICNEGADRYNAKVLCVKNCCMLAHWHAARQNKLVMSKMKGDFKPIDIMPAITYAAARNGRGGLSWGSGLNLQPMSQWAARIGNFTAEDMGRYDIRGTNVTAANKQRFAANALKYQSVPCYVRDNSFDTFYNIALAGLCCNIGTNSWPSGSVVDANGMAIGQGVSRGAHAVTVGGHAIEIGGTRYILFTNSHGPRFRQGTRIKQSTFGCYVTNQQWNQMFSIDNRFGRPYINFIEMVTL